jgi:RND superfamily putative drug exporter
LSKTIDKDFQKAEKLSVPITFVILLLAFGAFVAAGVPVLLAFSAVLGSIGLSAIASHVFHASDATSSVILLMGMAVGVDYSLFYLKREREERAAGHEGHEGLFRAAATSGQAVLISGFTVLIAMAGMLFAGTKIFTSIGIGAMLVVFVSLVGSLTVLPALLGKLGDRYIERGVRQVLAATALRFLRLFNAEPRWLVRMRDTPTLLQRAKGDRQESRVWGFVITRSMRRPAVAVALSTAVLIVLALPVLNIHTKLLSFTDLPKSLAVVETYDTIQASFPGTQDPAHVVVKADNVTTPRFAKAYADFKKRALATGVIHQPIRVSVNKAKTGRVDRLRRSPVKATTHSGWRASTRCGTKVIPPVLRDAPAGHARKRCTGRHASTQDFNQTMKHRAPIVFAFRLGFAFLLLTRRRSASIVIPTKAIILNLLSVGAAYGVLVWIFQDGHLQGCSASTPARRSSRGYRCSCSPVLFGLSMDYHVFNLSRHQGARRPRACRRPAVERGIRTTASTVTSAAAVMIAVFAIFASCAPSTSSSSASGSPSPCSSTRL